MENSTWKKGMTAGALVLSGLALGAVVVGTSGAAPSDSSGSGSPEGTTTV